MMTIAVVCLLAAWACIELAGVLYRLADRKGEQQ
jgi:hypothetical protein